jgi:hypothetical protein
MRYKEHYRQTAREGEFTTLQIQLCPSHSIARDYLSWFLEHRLLLLVYKQRCPQSNDASRAIPLIYKDEDQMG